MVVAEIIFIGLEELIDSLRGRGDILPGLGPGLEEVVDVFGVLAELGQAFGGHVDRLERITDHVERLGGGGQGLGRVGSDFALDNRGFGGCAAQLQGFLRRSPGRRSMVTSPINDRESRGTDPSRTEYLCSMAMVTSTPSG